MKLELLNRSLVVVAEHHNPTILHPEFLRNQAIVPADWEVTEGPVCTPMLAFVSFANGTQFRVDDNNLQIADTQPQQYPGFTLLPFLCARYVAALPHVRYKAVGVNFTVFHEKDDAANWLIERFLNRNASLVQGVRPAAIGLQLSFAMKDTMTALTLRAFRQEETQDGGKEGIIIDVNNHMDVRSTEETISGVNAASRRYDESISLCEEVLGMNRE